MSAQLRMLHSSDVHLGDALYGSARWAGFRRLVASARKADFLLIAGDLFDSARVCNDDLELVAGALAALEVPTILVPGNHDLAGPDSVLVRLKSLVPDERLTLALDPAGQLIPVPGVRATVWARAMVEHSPQNRPLEGHVAPSDGCWHVVSGHGHVVRARPETQRSSPISEAELDGLECDYVALGHWHRRTDVSTRHTRAAYAGAPVPESAPGTGTADLVRISKHGDVSVAPILLSDP